MPLLVPSRSVRVRPPQARRPAVAGLCVAAVAAAGLIGGCQTTPPPVQAAPPPERHATPQQAASFQQTLMQANPNARVGRVAKVGDKTEENLVAVEGLSPSEVKPGMTVSFYDGDSNLIANGHAFDLSATPPSQTYLIVDGIVVDTSSGAGRYPKAGDLAVFLGAEANR